MKIGVYVTLNHLHLGTKNLAKSIEFYSDIFGFKNKFDHDPGVFLENETGFLLAIDPVKEVPQLPSWYHLGFCLDSEQKVLDMYSKCKTLGVSMARDMMHEKDDFASFFIFDPDQNKIEVSWHND